MKKFIAYLIPTLILALPGIVSAETLTNPLAFGTISEFLSKILELVVEIGFPIIVLFIVFVGFQFVAASGNADKLKKARELLFWALVGALIVLGAQALSLAIKATVDQLRG